MNGIFKQLEKHDIGLLITIDEVTVASRRNASICLLFTSTMYAKVKKLHYSWQDCPGGIGVAAQRFRLVPQAFPISVGTNH